MVRVCGQPLYPAALKHRNFLSIFTLPLAACCVEYAATISDVVIAKTSIKQNHYPLVSVTKRNCHTCKERLYNPGYPLNWSSFVIFCEYFFLNQLICTLYWKKRLRKKTNPCPLPAGHWRANGQLRVSDTSRTMHANDIELRIAQHPLVAAYKLKLIIPNMDVYGWYN